jgi:hypothetical protein
MVGSSRNTSGGSCSIAAAISQRMRWPSDSCRTGWFEHLLQPHQRHQLVACRTIAVLRHAVDVAQQVEALDHRQVPPQLGALAEHHADPRHVASFAGARERQPIHLAAAGGRLQDAGEDLDGGRLAGAVGPDQADQLALSERS